MKSKIILGILLGLIVVWALTNDGDTIEESYMHQLDFENKLADISKGRIVIEDSQIEHRDKEEDNIYKANWKGFEIYAKMGKNDWVENSYSVSTNRNVFEDKTLYENYHKLMESLIRIMDSKLTLEEIDKLIAKGVDENESPNTYDFGYERYVGKDKGNQIRFTITDRK
ncbi:hypothetical protein ASE53_16430 [Bacillus sp. Root11]|nr:hypothetical protein ATN07_31890 [Bacillus thuringiensis serovar israelensis]KRD80654.1 hypothetical protein ASE53_16430 [Bacillus sp. Root11]KRD85185.1 hypothetical protein ASE54_16435 [Bacillus sp. Root131]